MTAATTSFDRLWHLATVYGGAGTDAQHWPNFLGLDG